MVWGSGYGQGSPEIELPDVEIVGEEGSKIESDKEKARIPEVESRRKAGTDVDFIELDVPTPAQKVEASPIRAEVPSNIDVAPNPAGPLSLKIGEAPTATEDGLESPDITSKLGPRVSRDVDAPTIVRPETAIPDDGLPPPSADFRLAISLPELSSELSGGLVPIPSVSSNVVEIPTESPEEPTFTPFVRGVENIAAEGAGNESDQSPAPSGRPVERIPPASSFTRLSIAYGPFNLLDFQGNYGAQSENLFVTFALDRRRTDSHYPDRGEGTDEVGGSIEIKLSGSSRITLGPSYYGQTAELTGNSSQSGTSLDEHYFVKAQSFFLPLSAETEFMGGNYLKGRLDWTISSLDALSSYRDGGLGGEMSYSFPLGSEGEKVSLKLGGHYTQLADENGQAIYGAIIYGLTGGARWRWGEWSLDLGARFDHSITSYNGDATRRLGQTGGVAHGFNLSPLFEVVWEMNDNLSPYLSSSGALLYPSLDGLYVRNRYVEANPLLSPELRYIDPLEVGLRLYYGDSDFSLRGKAKTTVSFIGDYVIWTDKDANLLLKPDNVRYVLIYGGGGDFEVGFLKNWTIFGGGTFKIYRNLDNPVNFIPYRPSLEAESGVRYRDEALGLSSELRGTYASSRFASDDRPEALAPFASVRGRVGKDIISNLEIFLAGGASTEHEIVKGLKAPMWEVEAGASLRF
jgi:hypothetical protein